MNITLHDDRKLPAGFLDTQMLPVVRVLYEVGQPLIYVTKTEQGQTMLAYVASETSTHLFTILAPISARALRDLELGRIGVREALTASWMWLVRQGYADAHAEVWSVSEFEIPDGHLPKPGTPLRQFGVLRPELVELEALALAATPGPWRFSRDNWNVQTPDMETDISVYQPESDADMTGEFIAAANPKVVLEILDELRQLKGDANMLSYELLGVITDVEEGHGFDKTCLNTIKRVYTALGNGSLKISTEPA